MSYVDTFCHYLYTSYSEINSNVKDKQGLKRYANTSAPGMPPIPDGPMGGLGGGENLKIIQLKRKIIFQIPNLHLKKKSTSFFHHVFHHQDASAMVAPSFRLWQPRTLRGHWESMESSEGNPLVLPMDGLGRLSKILPKKWKKNPPA